MASETTVAAIVLAAGKGSRYAAATGGDIKLLASFDGVPLVRRAVEAALQSQANDVIVVTGHAGDAVMTALAGLNVREVRNPIYANGQSTSLRAGVASVAPDAAGVVVMLADMPRVGTAVIDALIAEFYLNPNVRAVMPLYHGRRGNPVLLSRALFPAIANLTGDEGARGLLGGTNDIVTVPVDDDGITLDVDTPDALMDLR